MEGDAGQAIEQLLADLVDDPVNRRVRTRSLQRAHQGHHVGDIAELNEMVAFDANEALTPCREGRGIGAILFDRERLRQAEIGLFSPQHWGSRARPVGEGGRGSAWFIDAPTSGAARTAPAALPSSG
ncbi:hypothetical protein G6F22_017439 [Rhizopus arrhizus]|nr:hypothetical protein G6F22_017439 [Rhizopus arrhizus]